jgi:hypothetical protein
MFVVTEADAAAIRAVYEQRGEFAAAPAVPWHHRQRAGTAVRPHHRGLETAAPAVGEADAQGAAVTADALTRLVCSARRNPGSVTPRYLVARRTDSDTAGTLAWLGPVADPMAAR